MKHQKSYFYEMKERRKRSNGSLLSWRSWFLYILLLLLVSALTFSTLRLFFRDGSNSKLMESLISTAVYSGKASISPAEFIQESIIFPDQTLFFLKYPRSTSLITRDDVSCIYMSFNNSSEPELRLPVISVDGDYSGSLIVRCPLPPRGMIVSLAGKSNGKYVPGGHGRTHFNQGGAMLTWDSLAYEALIDSDNSTIVFVKGLNLRGGKMADPSKFKCVYGQNLGKSTFLLRSDVVSIGQEIVRCKTPPSVLRNWSRFKVSVRVLGRRTMNTIARPVPRFDYDLSGPKLHELCVCTMLRNQAKFLKEWVMYHDQIGVEKWFIYDNNSDDNLEDVIESLVEGNYNVTRYVWPWIKSQEAGFAHCALRARGMCRWVAFIDVDEFIHLPSSSKLIDVIGNDTFVNDTVGEIQVPCRSFGPSGLKQSPVEGVTIGYTCRVHGFERHKSIIRPEALNSTLINVVHHFHLRPDYKSISLNSWLVVINHYKYQVWEVFKDKFQRRVATYVADWKHYQNVGSKDRTPGLGTTAIEPPDWSQRFCDIEDTSLRDKVLETFYNPKIGGFPWQQ